MFVRVRDEILSLSHVTRIDLRHMPNRAGGPGVRLVLDDLQETEVTAYGREAEKIREFFEELTVDVDHLEKMPVDPLTVLSFGPSNGQLGPAEAATDVDVLGRVAS